MNHQSRRVGPALFIVVVVVNLITLAARWKLETDADATVDSGLAIVRQMPAFAIAAFVGALAVRRQAANLIGWLLIALSLGVGLSSLLESYARLSVQPDSELGGTAAVAWLASWSFIPLFTVIGFLFLLFPDGTLPSRRWRAVGWTLVLSTALLVVAFAVAPGDLDPDNVAVSNPLGLPERFSTLDGVAIIASLLLLLGSLVAAAASLVVRWRSVGPTGRQQLKWIAVAGLPLGVALAVHATIGQLDGVGTWTSLIADLAFTGFFVAVGIAVLRHRLFDVDVVINRALVAAALTGFVAVTYVGIVVGLGELFAVSSDLDVGLSLAATAVIAVAFGPVQQQAVAWANRLVYGQRQAPYEVLASLGQRLSSALSADDVLPAIADAAAAGAGAQRVRVEVLLPDGRVADATSGAQVPEPAGSRHAFAIEDDGQRVGAMEVDERPGVPLTAQQERLLADLAVNAAPALANVRLALQLQRSLDDLSAQAVELRASRRRLVTAQDEERRRLERDLHDGAQQQIVALTLQLRTAAAGHPGPTGELLDGVRAQLAELLGTLRDLARGVYPPLVAERGAVAAIQAHLAKARLRAVVDDRLPRGLRAYPELELTLYFCCLEALQNATKHAGAEVEVRVAFGETDGHIWFEVADFGAGFEPSQVDSLSTGLQGMRDRLAAVGGSLVVESAVGRGTTVRGSAPLDGAPAQQHGHEGQGAHGE